MAKESFGSVVKRRALGVGYLVVVASLVWLSIAIYQKKFTPVVLVTLKTDHTGNELQAASDVKERGLIVGEVRDINVASGNSCSDPSRASCPRRSSASSTCRCRSRRTPGRRSSPAM
jgi:hypothetical protein